MAFKRLQEVLNGKGENYLLPFFWQHGEDDEALRREIQAIYDCGIRALCVESRTHEDFCRDKWWHTMDVILSECASRGMKVWLLDDKHFPSGYANRIIPEKYPERKMWSMTERHMDVHGPAPDSCVLSAFEPEEGDEILGIYACKRAEGGERLTGEIADITERQSDGMVYWDIPEGCWRILWIYKTRTGYYQLYQEYADKLTEEGGDAFLEAVYEPHWEHYASYFGNTFAGFFSDEPCFGNNSSTGFLAKPGRKYSHFPYTPEVFQLMGENVRNLPALWFDTDDETMAQVRLSYMDTITKLYDRNFSGKLGNWCRAHGVEYIGHIIEDDDQHIGTQNSSGHYFRALDGQDMAGIDVVLCQTVPGMTDDIQTVPCSYNIVNPELYHFTLPKLGASHAHIQPLKKGRAMCEIFGAYGWAEGMPMAKWLADLFMVRGINRFVPHAFTPKFPDPDCPPHMFAGGTNPEYEQFKTLFAYMNRICHLTSGGVHRATAAVVYWAESQWTGGAYEKTDDVIRRLTENQLDADIVPWDYLGTAPVENGCLKLAAESYPALVVPYAETLPQSALETVNRLSENGLPVYFTKALPRCAETGEAFLFSASVQVVTSEELPETLRKAGFCDVEALRQDEITRFLRFYHYAHADFQFYYLTNENVFANLRTDLRLSAFSGGAYAVYDPMENRVYRKNSTDGVISVNLSPYASEILIFGDGVECFEEESAQTTGVSREINTSWTVSIAPRNETEWKPYRQTEKLFNVTAAKELPHFSGHIRYEASLNVTELEANAEKLILNLGRVGECAKVWVNGQYAGERICPPYRIDLTGLVKSGENVLTVEVTNHYGYEMRDKFSRYLAFGPSGLLGKVCLER